MHRGDSTVTPRFRLGGQRKATIALVQSRQQITQTRPHRPEFLVIPSGHRVDFFNAP
jgi:hypothetical protein